jgi:uroporphyrinogen decarboxylase
MALTQLELFQATLAHQQHEGFLFYAGFTPDLYQRFLKQMLPIPEEEIAAHLGMFTPVNGTPTLRKKLNETILEQRFGHYFEDVERPDGSFLNSLGVLEIPGSMYHFTSYVSPLRNASTMKEIEAFTYYPGYDVYDEDQLAARVQKAHADGKVAVCYVGHIYEDSWQIRGYEEFLQDMILNPEHCEYILDKVMERNIYLAQAAARAGVDFLRTCDDVANQQNMMFSLPMWRRFIKSRWTKVYEAARAIKPDIAIWYHSDGNITKILPELIEIGVDILNPVQPECMDIYALKKEFGHHLVFDGTIGTQTTMPFGSPEDVRRVVADRKEQLGKDGALILSPTHVLEPEVPIENILAFCEACREK